MPILHPTAHQMKRMAAELQESGLQKPGPSVESVEISMPTSAAVDRVGLSSRLWSQESSWRVDRSSVEVHGTTLADARWFDELSWMLATRLAPLDDPRVLYMAEWMSLPLSVGVVLVSYG